MTKLTRPIAWIAALAVSAGIAGACAFHSYIPDETVVDKMLASEHIVLARQDPENPFRYKAVDGLIGPVDGVELDQLVDTVTRRRLSLHPDHRVLFAREGSYGPWQRLAYLDADYARVIARIAPRLEDWQYGGDEERFQLFADLQDHANTDLRLLALRELDRAPYDLLRHLSMDPDADAILTQFSQPEMAEFVPIHILLLGLSGDAAARPMLDAGLDSALATQVTGYVGAWATAMIEYAGAGAVSQIADRLRTDQNLTPDTREGLIEAFAIHAQAGEADTQARVDTELRALLGEDAQYAAMVARQLGSRGNWSQAEALNSLRKSGQLRTADALISVSHYLSFAEAEGQMPAAED